MREFYRDTVYGLTLLVALFNTYLVWRGPLPADPPAVQAVASHPVAGLIVFAVLFLIAGLLNSAPLLTRFFRPKRADDETDSAETDEADFRQLFLEEQVSRDKYQDQYVKAREERDWLKNELDQLKAQRPEVSVKDSDPQLEVRFSDLRGKTMSKDSYCFDLINRGKQSPANFACIEDLRLGGYHIAFRNYPAPIGPFGIHDSIMPLYINNPDGNLSRLDIFAVFDEVFSRLKNPKLYELPIPMRATYQDDARNLFEVRCDLVYRPGEHIEVKNQKIRRVAAAIPQVDWS